MKIDSFSLTATAAVAIFAVPAGAQLTARTKLDGPTAGDRVLQEDGVGDLASLSMSIGLLEGEGWWGDGWWSKSSKASGDWWSKSSKASGDWWSKSSKASGDWWGGETAEMGTGWWDGDGGWWETSGKSGKSKSSKTSGWWDDNWWGGEVEQMGRGINGKAGKAGHQCSIEDLEGTFVFDIFPFQYGIGFKGEPRPAYLTFGIPPAKDGLKDPEGVMWALLSSGEYTCEKYISVQAGFATRGVLPFFSTMVSGCGEDSAVITGEYDCKSGKIMIGRPGLFDGSALAAPYAGMRATWLSGEETCEPESCGTGGSGDR